MMNQNDEQPPAPVAATPQQAGDTRDPWWWVERRVWTERMLTRLTTGESADRVWFRLWDKTYAPANLQSAFAKVWRKGGCAGADAQTVAHFARQAEAELARLHEQLRDGTYRPQPVRRVWIPKPGSSEQRPLGIPAVRDRTVQAALRHVLEPIFEAEFAEHSYGFRPGRGAKDALRRVDTLLQAGYDWVVDADLKSYFDTIPHDRLLALVKARVADGPVLALVESFLRAGVMEEAKGWQPTQRGTPQGGVISPLLANLYLDPFDHSMARAGHPLPQRSRGASRLEPGAGVGAGSGTGAASRKDADRQRRPAGWIRLPRVSLRAGHEMAAEEEPDEVAGTVGGEDLAAGWAQSEGHRGGRESHFAWLVWLLPAQPGEHVPTSGWLCATTFAQFARKAAWPGPAGTRCGASTLAESMVCPTGAAVLGSRT